MTEPQTAEERVALNRQLAQMLKGGVIMDVTTPEQAHIAEQAGARPLWRSSASPPTSARPAACPA